MLSFELIVDSCIHTTNKDKIETDESLKFFGVIKSLDGVADSERFQL